MLSMFRGLWARLGGQVAPSGGAEQGGADEPAIEYKGFRIRPEPYAARGQFQTAGVIEKDFADGPKEHRFIRAETHASREDAATFAVAKGRQIIDEQGDRIFDPPRPARAGPA
jgi:hypothetical protein